MKKKVVFIAMIMFIFVIIAIDHYANRRWLNLNMYILYQGEKIRLENLINDKYNFTHIDLNADGLRDLIIYSGTEMYVIDSKKMEIVYEGTVYERPIKSESMCGILYERHGGAPTHVDYQYTEFNNDFSIKNIMTWSCYDIDENNVYDELDLYIINEQEVTYEEWKKEIGVK